MDALVSDVQTRWAVAGLRGLGRSGLKVLALGSHPAAAGLFSRYAAARAIGPDGIEDPPGYSAAVARHATGHGPIVVYASQEQTIDALFAARDSLPPDAVLPYPGEEVTRALRDKPRLEALAGSVGLSAPRTLVEGTAAELLGRSLPVPCVIKPARGKAVKTRVVRSREELRGMLTQVPTGEELLVQERADGPLVGVAVVVDRAGRTVAQFQQVARRTWPPEAGGSTWAVSVAPDADLVRRSARLLVEAGYWGLAHLQFLRVARGPALIDVNTRFYGSLPLALAAGCNLPAILHAVTLGNPTGPPPPYRAGVTYRWLQAEMSAAIDHDPRRLVTRAPAPRCGAMWSSDDPLPGAMLAADAAAQRIGRRLPWAAARASSASTTRADAGPGERLPSG